MSSDQLLIVQAADYRRTRRRVPDLTTWTWCFILYFGTVATRDNDKLVDFLGYMDAIVRAAQKFAWPACEEYDRQFRQMVAGDEHREQAELEQDRAEAGTPVCGKYNRYRGDYKLGARRRYLHVFNRCRGSHPVSQCQAAPKE